MVSVNFFSNEPNSESQNMIVLDWEKFLMLLSKLEFVILLSFGLKFVRRNNAKFVILPVNVHFNIS